MKKKKLELAELKIKSFVTEFDNTRSIKGGEEFPTFGEDDSNFSHACNSNTYASVVANVCEVPVWGS